jgi:hypothetical protein
MFLHEIRKMNFLKALRSDTRKDLKQLKDKTDDFFHLAQVCVYA